MRSRGVYSLLPESPYITQSLKTSEDRILFKKRENWNEMVGYFDTPTPGELTFGLNESDINKWHKYLQNYLLTGASEQYIRYFVDLIGRPTQMADEILTMMKVIEERLEIEAIVRDFYNQDFEKLIDI